MAQSCNLIFSVEDSENFPLPERVEATNDVDRLGDFWGKSKDQMVGPAPITEIGVDRFQFDSVAAAAHGIDRAAQTTFAERLQAWTPDSREAIVSLASARPDVQAALIRGFGNPGLSQEMAHALPKALADFKKEFPGAVGLLQTAGKERGPGQTSWLTCLGNRGQGIANGIAYELLMANRMRSVPVDGLRLYSSDMANFGQKMQGIYGNWGTRTSTEADLLISRPGASGYREIYIDFKFRTASAPTVSKDQLEHVAIALKTGEIHEAHFVSNASFTGTTHRTVEELNKDLDSDNFIVLHEGQSWR